MKEKITLYTVILLSLIAKLILIFKYNSLLTLGSDDLNYIKSAVVLIKRGIFIYHNFNEPTVFITPVYPFFLATIFKLAGYGTAGLQAVRVVQAIISCITIWVIFLIARELFNTKVALVASFLVAFYIPNITTVGFFLTETLFTLLLVILIYLSLIFSRKPTVQKFALLGVVWAIAALCRPTIALYPILLFAYIFVHLKHGILKMIKPAIAMALSFVIVMSPWWIRNYIEYKTFIPLAASSGNPMLQGTYVNYKQSPQEVVYYKLGKNAFETNKIEMAVAKQRIVRKFKENFWRYLRWYTFDKTLLLWEGTFYWKSFFNIHYYIPLTLHYILLLGFIASLIILKNFGKYMLPLSTILYFNILYCMYMTFDRYAFPLMPLLSIFSAFVFTKVYDVLRKRYGHNQ